jgi:hypothetical protein
MPNVVKYEVGGSETNSIKKGNLWFGVGGRGYGPTDVTGFYNGISIPDGGYGFYQGSAGGFTYYTANNDDQLVALVNSATGNSFDISESLHYIAQQDGMAVMKKNENQIVTDGLVLNLDASSLLSYPTTGSVWYDISKNNNSGSLNNGGEFDSNGGIELDGIDDYIDQQYFTSTDFTDNQSWTIDALVNVVSSASAGNSRGGILTNQRYLSEPDPGGFGLNIYDKNYVINLTSGSTGDANSYQYLATTAINYNIIERITAIWDEETTTGKIYRNGELENSSKNSSYSWSARPEGVPQKIGTSTQGGWGYFFNMKLYNISLYNKALSQSEILQNYYGGPIVTDSLDLVYDAGNLVSYESGSLTTYPMTGSITGSLVNGAGFSSDGGGSFDFDGTDDVIDLDYSNVMYNTSTMTLECWIKSSDDGAGSEDWCTFMGTRYGNSIQIGRYSNTDKCGVLIATSTNGNLNLASGTTPIFDEKWHHCVVTFDNGVCKFYVDTNLEVSNSSRSGQTLTTSNSDKFGIGGSSGGGDGRNFYGKITSCKIYSKALTADEIWQNYLAQSVRFE